VLRGTPLKGSSPEEGTRRGSWFYEKIFMRSNSEGFPESDHYYKALLVERWLQVKWNFQGGGKGAAWKYDLDAPGGGRVSLSTTNKGKGTSSTFPMAKRSSKKKDRKQPKAERKIAEEIGASKSSRDILPYMGTPCVLIVQGAPFCTRRGRVNLERRLNTGKTKTVTGGRSTFLPILRRDVKRRKGPKKRSS